MIQFIVGLSALHSLISNTSFGIQEAIAPYSLRKILLSNTSWTQKLIKQMRKARDSRIKMSKQFDYLKYPRMLYIVKEHAYLYTKLGVTVGFGSLSSINNSHETLGCESLLLSRVRLIEDGTLRLCHTAGYRLSDHESTPQFLKWPFKS